MPTRRPRWIGSSHRGFVPDRDGEKRAGRRTGGMGQMPQVKPLHELEPVEVEVAPEELEAKVDSRRSTFSEPHFGHRTPSLVAPIRCNLEKTEPHS